MSLYTSATIVADSVSHAGARNITFQVHAPRVILAEINTHRVLGKSAASSRAIPVAKRADTVEEFPFVPEFGKNRPGMQATELLEGDAAKEAYDIWLDARDDALKHARRLDALKVHKQAANRVMEPYTYYIGVISGTEWENFFYLREHPDADPAFQVLARCMKEAYDKSIPEKTDSHLPYTSDCRNAPLSVRFRVSAARCARASYKLFSGITSTPEEDIKMCDDLITAGHLSPFDHPAVADRVEASPFGDLFWAKPDDHRHLWGWMPYRVEIEKKMGRKCKRTSHGPIDLNDLYDPSSLMGLSESTL